MAEELVLIVDIGGGTTDFSVIRVSPEGARRADRRERREDRVDRERPEHRQPANNNERQNCTNFDS